MLCVKMKGKALYNCYDTTREEGTSVGREISSFCCSTEVVVVVQVSGSGPVSSQNDEDEDDEEEDEDGKRDEVEGEDITDGAGGQLIEVVDVSD